MNMKVIPGAFGHQAPSDLSAQLREMADAVDRGEIKTFVAAYDRNDVYEMFFAASLVNSLTLSTLLQHRAVEKFRE